MGARACGQTELSLVQGKTAAIAHLDEAALCRCRHARACLLRQRCSRCHTKLHCFYPPYDRPRCFTLQTNTHWQDLSSPDKASSGYSQGT